MGKLWGFGTAAVDFRINTADYGENYRDKLLAQHTERLGGGASANCLVQAARLGGKVGWLGKLGRDAVADMIVAMLGSDGIDCSHIVYDDGGCSPFNVAVYAGKEKRRVGGFLLPNVLALLNEGDLSFFADAVCAGDWLVIEVGEIPICHCVSLAKAVRGKGAKVALDVDLDPIRQCGATADDVEELFALSNLIIPNVNSLLSIYGETNPAALCRHISEQYGVSAVVTAGADGAYYTDGNGWICHKPALPITAVDTVGAGDAFHGGLLYAVCDDMPLSDAVDLATVCAAANCMAFGAREGMPDREKVEEMLRWLKNNV